MKRAAALGAAAAALLLACRGWACSCGVPGLDSALTNRDDAWGARIAENLTLGSGSFDAHGNYRAYTDQQRYLRQDVLLLVAIRPWPRLELSLLAGYSHESLRASAARSASSGAADSFLRARFEALDEGPWYREKTLRPALALLASLRAPTGEAASAGGNGLGAWEGGLGVALEHSLGHRFRVGWLGEGGLRMKDEALGVERQLGPRLTTQLTAWYWPAPSWVASASTQLAWEGDVAMQGASQPGTASRYLQLGAGVAYSPADAALRPAIAVRRVAPIAGLGTNALVTTAFELSLAFVH